MQKNILTEKKNRDLAKLMIKKQQGKLSKGDREKLDTLITGFNARAAANRKRQQKTPVDWDSGKDPRAETAIRGATQGVKKAKKGAVKAAAKAHGEKVDEGKKRLKRVGDALIKKAGGIQKAINADYGANPKLSVHLGKERRNEKDGDKRNTTSKIRKAFLALAAGKEFKARMARRKDMFAHESTTPSFSKGSLYEFGDAQPEKKTFGSQVKSGMKKASRTGGEAVQKVGAAGADLAKTGGKAAGETTKLAGKAVGGGLKAAGTGVKVITAPLNAIPIVGNAAAAVGQAVGSGLRAGGEVVKQGGKIAGGAMTGTGRVAGGTIKKTTGLAGKGLKKLGQEKDESGKLKEATFRPGSTADEKPAKTVINPSLAAMTAPKAGEKKEKKATTQSGKTTKKQGHKFDTTHKVGTGNRGVGSRIQRTRKQIRKDKVNNPKVTPEGGDWGIKGMGQDIKSNVKDVLKPFGGKPQVHRGKKGKSVVRPVNAPQNAAKEEIKAAKQAGKVRGAEAGAARRASDFTKSYKYRGARAGLKAGGKVAGAGLKATKFGLGAAGKVAKYGAIGAGVAGVGAGMAAGGAVGGAGKVVGGTARGAGALAGGTVRGAGKAVGGVAKGAGGVLKGGNRIAQDMFSIGNKTGGNAR